MVEKRSMIGEFNLADKTVAVSFGDGKLTLRDIVTDNTYDLHIKEVLKVEHMEGQRSCVRLHHVVKHSNHVLRAEMCELYGDLTSCQCLVTEIQEELNLLNRPKRLLIFVNPKSGHKKGVKIYSSKVAPLLKLSGVEHTKVIVTQKAGEPKELLATYDMSLIHGIVSVGGDGMFSECVNGLLARLQNDSQIDMNDPESDIVASKIPIGIVPTGSGNYLANYIHRTKDIETAVLKIILGDHHMSNVVSLHEGRQLKCYASLLMEFGLIGRMMKDCENFRWMGPSRYSVVPLKSMMTRSPVDVEIEYIPEEPKRSPPSTAKFLRQVSLPASKFSEKFFRQRLFSMPGDYDADKKNDWKKLDGRVYGVDTYVVTQKEKGETLIPRFGDNALTMWVTDKCSLSDHVEQLTKLQKRQSGFLDFDFIRKVRTTRYRVSLPSVSTTMNEVGERHLNKKFYINADGEAIKLETPQFEVRLHQGTMPIYGTVEG
ncbi:Sphingosine kinase 1 [Mactra antiquata]